jgi:hypothetical protein
MIKKSRTWAAALVIAGAGALYAWGWESVRVAPGKVQAGKPVWILAKGNPEVNVHFQIDSGTECGTLTPNDMQTNEQGEAKSVFTASDPPASCEATIKTVIARSKGLQVSDPSSATIIRRITVVPSTPAAVASIDVTTAITIILIASFAIDRLVTLLMFLLPFAKLRRDQDPELQKKRERVTYIALAGFLGLLLGYFGDIRLLAGLGFSTNVVMNAIVTALILTAGSDSISALLKKMSSTGLGEAEPKPLVVQGDLTLKRPERARAAAQGETGGKTEA